MSIILPVTLCTLAAAAILNVWLSIRIGAVRTKEKIYVGDEDNEALVRRMRAQANFVENTPFVLLLIAAIELSGKGNMWLAYVAGAYIIARIAHGLGMDGGAFGKGRMIGTIATLLTLTGLGVVAVLIVYGVI